MRGEDYADSWYISDWPSGMLPSYMSQQKDPAPSGSCGVFMLLVANYMELGGSS